MNLPEAYHFVWDAQAHVCRMFPEKSFPEEHPDLKAAMDTLGTALLSLRCDIRAYGANMGVSLEHAMRMLGGCNV